MRSIARFLGVVTLALFFTQCSVLQQTTYEPSERDITNDLRERCYAIVDAYRLGNYDIARQELSYAFHILNDLGLRTDADKIDYLDRKYPPREWGLTYAIITEELAWSSNRNSYQSSDLVVTASNTSDAGGSEYLDTAKEDAYVYDRGAPVQQSTASANIGRKNYFDGDLHRFIQKEIREVAIGMGEPKDFTLPDDFVKEIEYYIRRYQNKEHYRKFFQRTLKRSRKYVPALRKYFIEKGFPEEIMYLAFIESGFNPVARSRANAVGMFQFIRSTGREYGLKVNSSIDERLSPVKSAIACREYLHDLLLELGSFTMALSSYNSGPGKTRRALRQLDDFRDRNFWSLREKTTVLKRETREYIPQIFASIVMAKPGNVEKFGFADVPFPDKSRYRMIIVPRQVNLKNLASSVGISLREIIVLNPDLPSNATVTPAKILDYPLFVPKSASKAIVDRLNNLERQRQEAIARSNRNRQKISRLSAEQLVKTGKKRYHTIKRGESLSVISQRYGVSIGAIKVWNKLRNDRIREGKRLVIYEPSQKYTPPAPVALKNGGFYHSVKPGESLSVLSDKYRVKIADIKKWNNLRSNRIITGDQLIIYPPSQRQQTTVASSQRQNTNISYHLVQSGETLSSIAEKYRLSIADIIRWNNLPNHRIIAGNRLIVRPASSGQTASASSSNRISHTVKAGESLSVLSDRYRVKIADIKRWNNLDRDLLSIGKKLVIYLPESKPRNTSQTNLAGSKMHQVASGESLSAIAVQYGVSVRDIKSWNRLNSDRIKVGDRLVIRESNNRNNGGMQIQMASLSQDSFSSSGTNGNHSISEANIVVSQAINKGERFMYAVANGNSLGEIASLFRVTVSDIKRWNGLVSNFLRVGQRLKIVSGKRMRFYKYQVQAGDSMEAIARRFNSNAALILTTNGKTSNALRAGEILSIYSQ